MTDLLKGDLRIVNMGIIDFYEDLRRQDVEVVQVDWRPPGTGDSDLDKVLEDII